ncbi:MAG: PadR family transcriptional regulator [Streptosporangiaceae bacterium]
MNSHDIHDHEMREHHHEHRPEGRGPRGRARFGPPGFEPGDRRGPGGPGGARFRGGPKNRGGDFEGPEDFGPRGFGRHPGFPGGGPGFGPPPGFGPFGPAGFGPRGRGHGRRGSRARRGDVRAAALALLAEEPLNGYQIIQRIEERSGGLWRPSPGSVYPALAQLEDEGLIGPQSSEGERRAYELTEAGRAYVAEHEQEMQAPWSAIPGDAANAAADMAGLVRQVHVAAFQVLSAGTPAQLDQARTVLTQARRSLYRILAEEEEPGAGQEADGQAAG